jgi:LAS superfamily LD-carboxypeptidase LdcB
MRGLAIAGAGALLLSALTGSDPSAWAAPASATTTETVAVRVPRSPALLTAVDTARRTAQASAYFAARRADADAVAAAAREAAAASLALDPAAVPADLVAAVHSATATLDSVAASPEPGSHSGDVAVATTVSTMKAAAAELFRLAEEVQAAAEGSVATDAVRWALPSTLVELESLVASADQAAARVALGVPIARIDAHPLAPGELCAVTFSATDELRCDAAAALEQLAAAYRAATGQDLVVTSAFRTFAEQAHLRETRGSLAAAPGTSNHERGVAVDLAAMGELGQFTAPAYLWMKEHAAAFGWHHPSAMEPGGNGPPEPWHWEYAG